MVATFTGCAWLSWRRLGSLIIDGGRELDVPRRLLEGAVLYRDVAWYWGPLAPWLNSALYRVFGVSSDTLMWSGLVTAALACLGLYLIARRFVGPLTSAWVSVAFLIVCAFAKRIEMSIFNFVLPFNFSATYGITLGIWSVLLLLRHAESGAPLTLAASAVLAGLAAMTKTEVALAVGAAHATFLVSLLPRVTWVRVAAWASGLGVAGGGYLVASHASGGLVWRSLVALSNPASHFYVTMSMGFRQLPVTALELGLSFLGWAAVLAAVRWAAVRASGPEHRRTLALAVAWAAAFAIPAFVLERTFFRAAPFLLLAILGWIAVRRLREGETALEGQWREQAIVCAFALVSLARIPLRAGPDHYGFFLLPPTLVCVAFGMTRHLAETVGPSASRRALAVGASVVLAGVATGGLLVSFPQLTRDVTEIRTARVHLEVDRDSPEATFVQYLSRLPPSTVCAAVPDGAGLVFAAGLTPPDDGMTSYLPMQVHDAEQERAILRAWNRKPPDLIISWGEDQRAVFGYLGFGQDTAMELARWIADYYQMADEPVSGSTRLLVARGRPAVSETSTGMSETSTGMTGPR
jgi:hypothetical protein